jgi:MarR family
VASWAFLTIHARVLLLVAHDPGVRLRDIAASLDITERSAFGIITDLVEAGYVVKAKDGRRNRYHIQAHLPLPEPTARERTVGEVLALLTGTDATVTGNPELVSGDLPPGPPSAMAGRDGESPRSATAEGRKGRDRRMGRER